jgi:hypothetical protein
MKSIDRANQCAICIAAINTRLGNNVGHAKNASTCDSLTACKD